MVRTSKYDILDRILDVQNRLDQELPEEKRIRLMNELDDLTYELYHYEWNGLRRAWHTFVDEIISIFRMKM